MDERSSLKSPLSKAPDWERYGIADVSGGLFNLWKTVVGCLVGLGEKKIEETVELLLFANGFARVSVVDSTSKTACVGDGPADGNDKTPLVDDIGDNELYGQDKSLFSKPWWKANFFLREPVLFGTWDGVFTACMINIFGIIIFLRTGWMVGNAGMGLSLVIIVATALVALVAALSAIGLCERCHLDRGGVYYLMAHVLGSRLGAALGILYTFGQAVSCSLYMVGFGESIVGLIDQTPMDEMWLAKLIGICVTLTLVGINAAGVKWVIRLQLVLLGLLAVGVGDFVLGSFVHTDIDSGFVGYDLQVFRNNTAPDYVDGASFFTVFGVFFPTATGVFAGINMSGDLRQPAKNIPLGTMAALLCSTVLYALFALILAATCLRYDLQENYMIAEKVSWIRVFWLASLYMASVSSCMGALYGSPRILQAIAEQNPADRISNYLAYGVSWSSALFLAGLYTSNFAQGVNGIYETNELIIVLIHNLLADQVGSQHGPNRVPLYSMIVTTFITVLFIFVGDVNFLGPIVTIPFMLTYAAVDYAYFALAMSFDEQEKLARSAEARPSYGSVGRVPSEDSSTGSSEKLMTAGAAGPTGSSSDLDRLFPDERRSGASYRPAAVNIPETAEKSSIAGSEDQPQKTKEQSSINAAGTTNYGATGPAASIGRMQTSWYSRFCNRWISLFGAVLSFVIMIAIEWLYSLICCVLVLLVYVYLGRSNPGLGPGLATFSLYHWIKLHILSCLGREPEPTKPVIVQSKPMPQIYETTQAQVTDENEDFLARDRYHQSEVVRGDHFREPPDDHQQP